MVPVLLTAPGVVRLPVRLMARMPALLTAAPPMEPLVPPEPTCTEAPLAMATPPEKVLAAVSTIVPPPTDTDPEPLIPATLWRAELKLAVELISDKGDVMLDEPLVKVNVLLVA